MKWLANSVPAMATTTITKGNGTPEKPTRSEGEENGDV
jgi:hypothetical protein